MQKFELDETLFTEHEDFFAPFTWEPVFVDAEGRAFKQTIGPCLCPFCRSHLKFCEREQEIFCPRCENAARLGFT